MKKIVLYGVIIFQILIIVSLVRGIEIAKRSKERIDDLENTKAKLVQEKIELEKKQKEVESEYYLEKVAREELHLSKPGETVVIVPDSLVYTSPIAEAHATPPPTKPNWIKWIEILSGKIDKSGEWAGR